jgi:hypothetical protein
MHPIKAEAQGYARLRERLRAEFPDADDATLHDTLDGETDLHDMIATLTRSALDDRSTAEALQSRIEDMRARHQRYTERARRKTDLVAEVMDFADLKTLHRPEFTLSLRAKPPAVVVRDERAIPLDYWRPQPAKLDKQALKDALKAGACVPGATLDNGGATVTVRTK